MKRGPIVDDDATMDSNDGDGDSGSTKGTGLGGGDNVRRDDDWGSTDDDEADDRGVEPSEGDPVARGTEDCWQQPAAERHPGEGRGPAAEDDAKIEPNDGDGDGGSTNGDGSRGDGDGDKDNTDTC